MTPAARSFVAIAIVIIVTAGVTVGGLGVILETRDESEEAKVQSQENFDLLQQVKELSESNATLLRVVLAVTGCTVDDTAEQCAQRIAATGSTQGAGFIAEIDCRVRAALALLPPTPAGEACIR